MTQYNKAVLVVERENRTGIFELRNNLEPRPETRRNFLIGGRGGAINEILTNDEGSRESFYLDLGTGVKEKQFQAKIVSGDDSNNNPLQMGDGSSDETDPNDVTKWDATNSHVVAQWQVLNYWLSETKLDSNTTAELHFGEHSDGSEIESGVYSPLKVTPQTWFMDRKKEDSSTALLSLTFEVVATFESATDAVTNDQR